VTDAAFTQVTIVGGAAASVLATLFTLMVQVYREGRTRRWALEDAAALAKTVREEADYARKGRYQIQDAVKEVHAVAQEAAAASKSAEVEANHVNQKIVDLNKRLLEKEQDDTLPRMRQTGEETLVRVTAIRDQQLVMALHPVTVRAPAEARP
jgi:hypothetical protein